MNNNNLNYENQNNNLRKASIDYILNKPVDTGKNNISTDTFTSESNSTDSVGALESKSERNSSFKPYYILVQNKNNYKTNRDKKNTLEVDNRQDSLYKRSIIKLKLKPRPKNLENSLKITSSHKNFMNNSFEYRFKNDLDIKKYFINLYNIHNGDLNYKNKKYNFDSFLSSLEIKKSTKKVKMPGTRSDFWAKTFRKN